MAFVQDYLNLLQGTDDSNLEIADSAPTSTYDFNFATIIGGIIVLAISTLASCWLRATFFSDRHNPRKFKDVVEGSSNATTWTVCQSETRHGGVSLSTAEVYAEAVGIAVESGTVHSVEEFSKTRMSEVLGDEVGKGTLYGTKEA